MGKSTSSTDSFKIRALVDSALLTELFLERNSVASKAEVLMEIGNSPYIELFVSDLCLTKITFLFNQANPSYGDEISSYIRHWFGNNIINVNKDALDRARYSGIENFESAVEIALANQFDIGCIVTHLPNNFTDSNLSILSVEDIEVRHNLANITEEEQHPIKISEYPNSTDTFNRDVQFLLQANNPHARSLLAFIHRTIRQFDLHNYITEVDVVVEAYLRGVNYTRDSCQQILQPKAWLRLTSYHAIRDLQRSRLRYFNDAFDELLEQGTVDYNKENYLSNLAPENAWVKTEIQRVVQAFQMLDESDQVLLRWKIIENLSWQNIHDRLTSQGGSSISLETLRKRGQRALERLRKNYHFLESE